MDNATRWKNAVARLREMAADADIPDHAVGVQFSQVRLIALQLASNDNGFSQRSFAARNAQILDAVRFFRSAPTIQKLADAYEMRWSFPATWGRYEQ